MQFRDGRQADGPIALSEVQGYAYQAAVDTADLFDAYGEPGGQALRDFAEALQQNFRERFWVEDDGGPFPAMALDGHGEPLDIPGSNMGHLLGTGILDASEARLVADRLLSPELFSGYGVHTISRRAAGFWPFSYHCGSVWSHDTAIAVRGLLAEGFLAEARTIAEGLLAASGVLRAPPAGTVRRHHGRGGGRTRCRIRRRATRRRGPRRRPWWSPRPWASGSRVRGPRWVQAGPVRAPADVFSAGTAFRAGRASRRIPRSSSPGWRPA